MLEDERSLEPLLDWAERLSFSDLPGQVVHHARAVFIDHLAGLWAGRTEPEVLGIARWIERRGIIEDPLWLGLVLGIAAVAQELDEGHRESMGHPGSHVIPTVLATLYENPRITMEEALLALVVGYEVAARIASAGVPRSGSHPHGTWGTVGAAVARERLSGSPLRLRKAVLLASGTGLATAFSAPLEGRTVRNLYAGLSAFLGMLASEWKDDVSGIFSPTETLFSVWDGRDITRDLGSRYAITRNYFKTIAACRYVHGAVEAIEKIRGEYPFQRSDIDTVVVETYSPASKLSGAPFNTLSSKFSIPYAVLCAVDGRVRDLESFHEPLKLTSTDRGFLSRVIVKESKQMTQQLPKVRAVRVTMRLSGAGSAPKRCPYRRESGTALIPIKI